MLFYVYGLNKNKPMKNYTKDEVVLCTYIARFGRAAFREHRIRQITNRPLESLKMKVQNIAFMLCENNYDYHPSISKLSGSPKGKKDRDTNWDIVKNYTTLEKEDFLEECRHLIKKHDI